MRLCIAIWPCKARVTHTFEDPMYGDVNPPTRKALLVRIPAIASPTSTTSLSCQSEFAYEESFLVNFQHHLAKHYFPSLIQPTSPHLTASQFLLTSGWTPSGGILLDLSKFKCLHGIKWLRFILLMQNPIFGLRLFFKSSNISKSMKCGIWKSILGN